MIRWARMVGKQVTCPKCGTPSKKIEDYNIYDDMSLYFILKCEKCSTRHVVLTDACFTDKWVGERSEIFKPIRS